MNVHKKFCLIIYLFFAALWLVSCSRNTDELGGVPVTPEMLESVSRSISEQQESDPVSKSENMKETALTSVSSVVYATTEIAETVDSDVVYWTESGTVYHLTKECSSLRHSENILQGSVDEALLAKKERACKSCS